MWIKWKYNDHGWPDFKELEIPDDLDGFDTVENYFCECTSLLPTWSERFMIGRLKWEKLNLPKKEIKARKVAKLLSQISIAQTSLLEYKRELKKLTDE